MDEIKNMPREVVTGTATGLIFMSIFTVAWACLANFGLQGNDDHIVLFAFTIPVLFYISQSVHIYRNANLFQPAGAEDAIEKKKKGKWFGIIFALEGVFIFLAINIVTWIGHAELTLPAMALVVGLHFFPLAWVFERKIDYLLGSWATVVALTAAYYAYHHLWNGYTIATVIGVGMALTTSAYAIYMITYGRKLLSGVKQQPHYA